MKRLAQMVVWGSAVMLTLLAGVLAQRRESVCDFMTIVMAGRLQFIAARDGHLILALSNYRVAPQTPSGVGVDKTSPWLFEFDRDLFATKSQVKFGGFRCCVGDRVVGQKLFAQVLEAEFPQWVLTLPLLLLLAKWYRRVCVRSARVEAGQCIVCGYDLRGNESDRCSECGTLALRSSVD